MACENLGITDRLHMALTNFEKRKIYQINIKQKDESNLNKQCFDHMEIDVHLFIHTCILNSSKKRKLSYTLILHENCEVSMTKINKNK